MTPQRLYKSFAFAEAVTWTLLISALILRAVVETPDLLVTIVGGTHGLVFLGYGITAALVGVNQRWGIGRILAGISLAIVPFATVPFERSVERKGLLAGAWRRDASDHPSDSHWFDQLFRWFIRRPALLIAALVLTALTIFALLLWIGPPGGWPED